MSFSDEVTRREFVGTTAVTLVALGAGDASAAESFPLVPCSLTVNNQPLQIDLEPRVTLLDFLRERLHLTGTKKGCDHGQCGACTVLVDGVRVNSCLTLAVAQDGHHITTIEGIASGAALHPMQAAFIEHDGFQCGFCTSGQICSAIAMIEEWRSGAPSAVTSRGEPAFDSAEVRERMAGNICRCGAYPNIVAAIRAVHEAIPKPQALAGSPR